MTQDQFKRIEAAIIKVVPEFTHLEKKFVLDLLSTIIDSDDKINFDEFWNRYPNRKGKFNAKKIWGNMSNSDRAKAVAYLPEYISESAPYFLMPERYLKYRRWLDDEKRKVDDLFK
ncbi:MAG: hypothetical protein JXR36_04215 [Bacteroidales bacterium]|nr:hypothetical protein [Bacteroidales bacterium]